MKPCAQAQTNADLYCMVGVSQEQQRHAKQLGRKKLCMCSGQRVRDATSGMHPDWQKTALWQRPKGSDRGACARN